MQTKKTGLFKPGLQQLKGLSRRGLKKVSLQSTSPAPAAKPLANLEKSEFSATPLAHRATGSAAQGPQSGTQRPVLGEDLATGVARPANLPSTFEEEVRSYVETFHLSREGRLPTWSGKTQFEVAMTDVQAMADGRTSIGSGLEPSVSIGAAAGHYFPGWERPHFQALVQEIRGKVAEFESATKASSERVGAGPKAFPGPLEAVSRRADPITLSYSLVFASPSGSSVKSDAFLTFRGSKALVGPLNASRGQIRPLSVEEAKELLATLSSGPREGSDPVRSLMAENLEGFVSNQEYLASSAANQAARPEDFDLRAEGLLRVWESSRRGESWSSLHPDLTNYQVEMRDLHLLAQGKWDEVSMEEGCPLKGVVSSFHKGWSQKDFQALVGRVETGVDSRWDAFVKRTDQSWAEHLARQK